MINILDIIVAVFAVSCVISVLFVIIRTYFCYFETSKEFDDKSECENKDVIVESISKPIAKKKTTRKKKQPVVELDSKPVAKKKTTPKKKIENATNTKTTRKTSGKV